MADGTIIDTKGWKGWEWTHGIALTALINVSAKRTVSLDWSASPLLAVDCHCIRAYSLSG